VLRAVSNSAKGSQLHAHCISILCASNGKFPDAARNAPVLLSGLPINPQFTPFMYHSIKKLMYLVSVGEIQQSSRTAIAGLAKICSKRTPRLR